MHRVQEHLSLIQKWLQDWRIKVNETKCTQVIYTWRRSDCPHVYLNNIEIPRENVAKYLGLHFDSKMTWKVHVTKKEGDGYKNLKMYWFLGKKSLLSLENKLFFYKMIIKPIWNYGIELWGCSSKSNVNIIRRFQFKILRMIVCAPRYVSNQKLLAELSITTVEEERQKKSKHTFPAITGTWNPISHQLSECKKPETAQANLAMWSKRRVEPSTFVRDDIAGY